MLRRLLSARVPSTCRQSDLRTGRHRLTRGAQGRGSIAKAGARASGPVTGARGRWAARFTCQVGDLGSSATGALRPLHSSPKFGCRVEWTDAGLFREPEAREELPRAVSQTSPVRSMADANTRTVPSDPMSRGVSGLQQWKDAVRMKKALKASTQHTRRAVAKQGPARSSRCAAAKACDPRGHRPRAGAPAEPWRPTSEHIVDVLPHETCNWVQQTYAVVAITLDATKAMLGWLVPKLEEKTGAHIVERNGRASSIIFTSSWSCSGAHADVMDTIIFCHVGKREVWLAAPNDSDSKLPRLDLADGRGPKLLDDVCDPVVSSVAGQYLSWGEPVEFGESARVTNTGVILHAGDVLFVPEGWWHSVKAATHEGEKKGALGIALEVRKGTVNVSHALPYVFKGVGPSARRTAFEWRTWQKCMCEWAPAVTAWYCSRSK